MSVSIVIAILASYMLLLGIIQSLQNKKRQNGKLAEQLNDEDFDTLSLVEELRFLVLRKKLTDKEIQKVIAFLNAPIAKIENYKILNAKKIATDTYVLISNCQTYRIESGRNGNESIPVIKSVNFLFRIKEQEIEIYSFFIYHDLHLKNLQLNFCFHFFKYIEKAEKEA